MKRLIVSIILIAFSGVLFGRLLFGESWNVWVYNFGFIVGWYFCVWCLKNEHEALD
jgi:hypothetical protein